MTPTRLTRPMTVIALACLLLGACTGPGGGNGPSTPAQSSAGPGPPPPLRKQPDASDGETVRVGEVGFTILREATGGADVLWAATFENASQTDLLAHVDFELRWRTDDGQVEIWPWYESPQQRSYDVLPGRSGVVGGVTTTVGFVPESLEVTVNTDEWYPIRDLAANGVPVGVEVTSSSIEAGDVPRLGVRADYISSYEDMYVLGDEDLRLLVVVRDARGRLLGAVAAADFGGVPPGQWTQVGWFPRLQWPDDADEHASEVAIVRICCAWVGIT